MIKSMTAYAEGAFTVEEVTASAVLRSYNSRHLNVATFLPSVCQRFEEDLKKLVAGEVARGRVEIYISLETDAFESFDFKVNDGKAQAFYQALVQLKQKFNIDCDITLDHLLSEKDMIVQGKRDSSSEIVWKAVAGAVKQALSSLDIMRSKEGENLARDLEMRLTSVKETLSEISKKAEALPEIYRERLTERISSLLSENDVMADYSRIVQEAAIVADKSDISEEIVRASSHLKQARQVIYSMEPAGRKLTFLIQELNREFTTMGSKSGSADISAMVVVLKSELEKIREQVQNIE